MNDELAALAAKLEIARDALQYTLAQIDYLQHLWGKEGITDNVADRLREALEETK